MLVWQLCKWHIVRFALLNCYMNTNKLIKLNMTVEMYDI